VLFGEAKRKGVVVEDREGFYAALEVLMREYSVDSVVVYRSVPAPCPRCGHSTEEEGEHITMLEDGDPILKDGVDEDEAFSMLGNCINRFGDGEISLERKNDE
jgi:hypothetical protein